MVCMSERYQFYIKAENFSLNKEKYKVPEFIISNENLVSGRKVLSKIKADNFIGICGGGTQILYILSLLTRKNKLKSIKLIDYDKNQLLNFNYIVKAYKKNKDTIHYITDLSKRPDLTEGKLLLKGNAIINRSYRFIAPMLFNKDYGFEETNLRKPKIKGDLKIDLIYENFFKYIKTAKLKEGKYLIYVSNILTYMKNNPVKLLFKVSFWKLVYHLINNIDKGAGRIQIFGNIEYFKAELSKIAKRREIFTDSIFMVYMWGFRLFNRDKYVLFFIKQYDGIELLDILPGPKINKPQQYMEALGLGDSMLPAIKSMEKVLVMPISFCTRNDVKVGDIVTYWSIGYNRKGKHRFYHRANVIHRVIGKTLTCALIKGDNREYIEKVPYYKINGKVVTKKFGNTN